MSGLLTVRRSMFRAFGFLPRPFRRSLIRALRPSWTAGSVAVLENGDGHVLFVKPVYRDGWTLPGGLVDRGEDPADAAVREMREEVGASVRVVDGPIVVIDPRYRRLETVFRVELVDGTDPASLGVTTPELSGLAWHPLDSPPGLEPETAAVLALVAESVDGSPTARIVRDLES